MPIIKNKNKKLSVSKKRSVKKRNVNKKVGGEGDSNNKTKESKNCKCKVHKGKMYAVIRYHNSPSNMWFQVTEIYSKLSDAELRVLDWTDDWKEEGKDVRKLKNSHLDIDCIDCYTIGNGDDEDVVGIMELPKLQMEY